MATETPQRPDILEPDSGGWNPDELDLIRRALQQAPEVPPQAYFAPLSDGLELFLSETKLAYLDPTESFGAFTAAIKGFFGEPEATAIGADNAEPAPEQPVWKFKHQEQTYQFDQTGSLVVTMPTGKSLCCSFFVHDKTVMREVRVANYRVVRRMNRSEVASLITLVTTNFHSSQVPRLGIKLDSENQYVAADAIELTALLAYVTRLTAGEKFSLQQQQLQHRAKTYDATQAAAQREPVVCAREDASFLRRARGFLAAIAVRSASPKTQK